jgi:hypothetical protein
VRQPLLLLSPLLLLLFRCLMSMARFKDVAPHLLQRLVSAAVVNAPATPMEFAGMCCMCNRRFDVAPWWLPGALPTTVCMSAVILHLGHS